MKYVYVKDYTNPPIKRHNVYTSVLVKKFLNQWKLLVDENIRKIEIKKVKGENLHVLEPHYINMKYGLSIKEWSVDGNGINKMYDIFLTIPPNESNII